MKLYLASSLCYVSDIIVKHENLSWKTIWCIWNAADSHWWKEAKRNQLDYKFLLSTWAELIDININKPWYEFGKLDGLFIWGWNTYDLAELIFNNWYAKKIKNALEKWIIYMWTSAWSRLLSKHINFEKEWRVNKWLWVFDQIIVWHWWRPDKRVKREKEFEKMFNRKESCILLLENEVIISDWKKYTIEQSKKWSLDTLYKTYPKK
jgi:hypothetical protein